VFICGAKNVHGLVCLVLYEFAWVIFPILVLIRRCIEVLLLHFLCTYC
jgi:hypothetical protein